MGLARQSSFVSPTAHDLDMPVLTIEGQKLSLLVQLSLLTEIPLELDANGRRSRANVIPAFNHQLWTPERRTLEYDQGTIEKDIALQEVLYQATGGTTAFFS